MAKTTTNAHVVRDLLKALPDTTEFFRKLAVLPDQKKAEQEARNYCETLYRVTYGEEMSRLKSEIAEAEQRSKQLVKAIAAQEQLIAKTDRMIRVQDKLKREFPDKQDRNFRTWLDILLGIICLIAAVFVLGMGASNVFSIIMSSGNPVFLDEPRLAWMLSGLLPLGAFALEFFKRHLQSDRSKRIYTITIFALSAILLLVWVVLFALVFGSPGDDSLDFDKLLKPAGEDHLGQAFTMVQLLAELMVGAALFTSGADLFAKHSPTRLVESPDYTDAVALLNQMKKDYAPIAANIHHKKARSELLEHAKGLFVSEQMINYARICARLCD
ncbi:MAG: hypothetical protein KDF59_06180 [Nitrosomonas sp.]|nr:hypothetical protein [Nitrosomonas sp.]